MKSKGFSDEARARGISRQRVWQERKRKAGRCMTCGAKTSKRNKALCETHRLYKNEWQKKAYRAKATAA